MGISDFVAKQFVDVIDWTEPLREALALCSPIDFVLSVRKSSGRHEKLTVEKTDYLVECLSSTF